MSYKVLKKETEEAKQLRRENKRRRKAEKSAERIQKQSQNESYFSDCSSKDSDHVGKERKEREKQDLITYLQNLKKNRVILNIGGTRFETSKETLTQDSDSLFALLFTDESPVVPVGNSYFIDRDPAHFRLILNYLRHSSPLPVMQLSRGKGGTVWKLKLKVSSRD